MKYPFLRFMIPLSLAVFWLPSAQSEVIFQDDFENGLTEWSYVGSNVSIQNGGGINNSKGVKIDYTKKGTAEYTLRKAISSRNLSEVYVKFDFKLNGSIGGSKFLKLFGKSKDPEGSANSTFALKYDDSKLQEISYGNGSGTSNDTQTTIRYGGAITDPLVNIVYSSGTFDPRDNNWHTFQARMKYNDNGLRNGVYQVWVDGTLRIHATNIKNRHDNNSMFFRAVELAGYTSDKATELWSLWYDNLVISTQPIEGGEAFIARPKAPTLSDQ